MSDSLWPHGLQHTRLPCPSLSPWVCSNSCPFSGWCHPTISSLLPPSPPALSLSKYQGLFQWIDSSHQGPRFWSFSFSLSPSNEYSGLISFRIVFWSPCCPRDFSRVFSSTTFKSISASMKGRICDISCISSPWVLYIFPSFPGKIPNLGRIFPTFVGPNPHPGSAGVLESLGSLHPNQLPDNLCMCPVPTGCPEPGSHTHHRWLWRTGEPGSPGYARALVLHTLS